MHRRAAGRAHRRCATSPPGPRAHRWRSPSAGPAHPSGPAVPGPELGEPAQQQQRQEQEAVPAQLAGLATHGQAAHRHTHAQPEGTNQPPTRRVPARHSERRMLGVRPGVRRVAERGSVGPHRGPVAVEGAGPTKRTRCCCIGTQVYPAAVCRTLRRGEESVQRRAAEVSGTLPACGRWHEGPRTGAGPGRPGAPTRPGLRAIYHSSARRVG